MLLALAILPACGKNLAPDDDAPGGDMPGDDDGSGGGGSGGGGGGGSGSGGGSAGESCSTCPTDCGACPVTCGSYGCQAGETCSSCPTDCGARPTTPPPAPALSSPADGATNVNTWTVTWGTSTGATSYRVQMSKSSLFTIILVDAPGITATSYDFNLGVNTKYYWRVNATNAAGTSAWSAVWSLTTGVYY